MDRSLRFWTNPLTTERRGAAVGGSVGQLALPERKGPPLSGTQETWVAPNISFYKTHFHGYSTCV